MLNDGNGRRGVYFASLVYEAHNCVYFRRIMVLICKHRA